MSDHIPDEWVEAAARRAFGVHMAAKWEEMVPWAKEDWQKFFHSALGAVAPLIEAKALREAADWLHRMEDGRSGGYYDAGRHIIARLRDRADQIERESVQ